MIFMRGFNFKIAIAVVLFGAFAPCSSYAQLKMDQETLLQGIGYFQDVKATAQEIKDAGNECNFNASEFVTIYYLAVEYNMEKTLNEGSSAAPFDASEAQRKQEEREIEKALQGNKKYEEESSVVVGKIDLLGVKSATEFAGLQEAEIKQIARQLNASWATSLTDGERAVLAKANNKDCTFQKVKVFGGILDKVLQQSGIPGLENINQILEGGGGIGDLGNILGGGGDPAQLLNQLNIK
ncbi:MAG: hypothetical protein LBR35_00460 [Rickettsiales bacterium]|jgi:hypothetical protein|nr:hypothetical protein [Rickettsiales bacterium]